MAQHRLRKSEDQWVGGVLGGIANYFNMNPDVLRIAFLVFLIVLDLSFLIPAYIVMLILMPETGSRNEEKSDKSGVSSVRTWRIMGMILIIAGIVFLLENQFGFPWVRFRHYLYQIQHRLLPPREIIISLAMIGGGIWLISKNRE